MTTNTTPHTHTLTVRYNHGRETVGELRWELDTGGCFQALGGTDPGNRPDTSGRTTTTVIEDGGDVTDNVYSFRVLAGWVHPDQLSELHGADGPDVVHVY